MATNPKGRSFLSYQRKEAADATLIIRAQQRRGIPTWQDVENLTEGSTEGQIREQLADSSTANGVLWLTPGVKESSFILKVEIPLLVARLATGDPFFLTGAVAGGLKYADAAALIQESTGVHDIKTWNLFLVNGQLSSPQARQLARRVLDRRVLEVVKGHPKESPIKIEFAIRQKPAFNPDMALTVDWWPDFVGRHATDAVWVQELLPAIQDVVSSFEQRAGGLALEFSGIPTISAATALGVTCLAPRQLKAAWRQHFPGGEEQQWSLDIARVECKFTYSPAWRSTDASDVAVLLSVSDDVETAFANTPNLPPLRAVAVLRKSGSPPHTLTRAGEASDLAFLLRDSLRKLRQDLGSIGRLHLFMAVPVGLAFLVGQLLNTFGEVQTYEHVPASSTAPGHYEPEVLLHPSS